MTPAEAIIGEPSEVVGTSTEDVMPVVHTTKTDGSFEAELQWGTTFREAIIAEEIAKKLWPGSTLFRCKAKAHLDWAIVQENTIVAYLEVKARRNAAGAHQHTIYRAEKHQAARAFQRFMSTPSYAVVLFTDEIRTQNLYLPPAFQKDVERLDRGETALHSFYPVAEMDSHPEVFEIVRQRLAAFD